MSRTKKFAINSIAAALLQMTLLVIGFILPKVILTVYGSSINGLVSSIRQFISYFDVVEAGLGGAAIYALYKPLAEKDDKTVSAVVSTARHYYNLVGCIFVGLVFLLAVLYPFITNDCSLSRLDVGLLVVVVGMTGTVQFFIMAKYRVLFTADQRLYVLSIVSILAIVANTALVVYMAYSGASILVARSVALAALIIYPLFFWLYVRKHYRHIDFHAKVDKSLLEQRWSVFYLKLLGATQQGLPVVLATIFTSLLEVSVFAIYNMVIKGITGILGIFINNLFPSFGDLIASKNTKRLQQAYTEFEVFYYMMITWVFSCLFVLIVPFVKLFTRGIEDTSYDRPGFAFLITLNCLIYNIKIPQGMLVQSAGLFRTTRLQTSIQLVIAVLACCALAPVWGLNGIMFGMLLSNAYRAVDLAFYIPRHVTKLTPGISIARMLRVLLGVTAVVILLNQFNFHYNHYLQWLYSAIIVSTSSVLIVVLLNIILDRQAVAAIVRRIFRRS
ncbi:hypothetical protein P4E94_09330 [Pontiellaceae bacterium B12219]|nr:hypothetical protein [Pontiellaceae bacterium B12219]